MTTVADLVAHLETLAPSAWAEPWDRVGLLAGDPAAEVLRVFVSLDATPGALRRAGEAGAQVLLTHHPAFLEPPGRLVPAAGIAGVTYSAVASGVALVAAHTNLDRSPEGAEALPAALGLTTLEPLERSGQPVTVVVTYVPPPAVPAVLEALERAGAGRIGRYEGCSFTGEGVGRFRGLPGSSPKAVPDHEGGSVTETRIEAVCAPAAVEAVVAAVRGAHPYEEPVVLTTAADLSRGAARLGRVCEGPEGATLASVARLVAERLGAPVRVRGEMTAPVRRIATAGGSGGSGIGDALTASCDVIVTGELRYHEALDAAERGLAVIEAGHDVTEWPLVPVLAAMAAGTPGLDAARVHADEPRTGTLTVEGA